MYCDCKQKEYYLEELQKRDDSIQMLRNILYQQKIEHLNEIKQINRNIQQFAEEKQMEIQLTAHQKDHLIAKIQHYKQKCGKLYEKIKEGTNLVKQLNGKKVDLEGQLTKLKTKTDKQKQKNGERNEYINELKQVIHLQELQILQMNRKMKISAEENRNLQLEVESLTAIKHRFHNLQEISNQQYGNQIIILKDKLRNEFQKNTNDILKEMQNIPQSQQLFQKTMSKCYGIKLNQQTVFQDEIKKICNYVEYGKNYSKVSIEFFSKQANTIFNFIKHLWQEKDKKSQEAQHYKNNLIQIISESKEKVNEMENQLTLINYKKNSICNIQTQTVQNSKIFQVIEINSHLKVKLYFFSSLLSTFASLIIFLFNIINQNKEKMTYFHFTEKVFYQIIATKKKTNKFKRAAKAIFFLQVLKKKLRKQKRQKREAKWDCKDIEAYFPNNNFAKILLRFINNSVKQKARKNSKIEEISKFKCDNNIQLQMIQILNQQTLNFAENKLRINDICGKFMFQIQLKLSDSH